MALLPCIGGGGAGTHVIMKVALNKAEMQHHRLAFVRRRSGNGTQAR